MSRKSNGEILCGFYTERQKRGGARRMTRLTVKDEVEFFLGGCLHGAFTVNRGPTFERALFEVLVRIWEEIEPEVDRIAAIILADGSSVIDFEWPHPPNIEDRECVLKKSIIFFPGELCDEAEMEIKRIIAHEFAHFILKHDHGGPSNEKAADDLAAKWGFPKK